MTLYKEEDRRRALYVINGLTSTQAHEKRKFQEHPQDAQSGPGDYKITRPGVDAGWLRSARPHTPLPFQRPLLPDRGDSSFVRFFRPTSPEASDPGIFLPGSPGLPILERRLYRSPRDSSAG